MRTELAQMQRHPFTIAPPAPRQRPGIEGAERHYYGALDQIESLLPEFERVPFAADSRHGYDGRPAGAIANRFMDVIVRREDRVQGLPSVPVGTVSKTYRLLQHRDLFRETRSALRAIGLAADQVQAEAHLTSYGARMQFSVRLPHEFDFDPGDGNPMALQLLCLNSVDGSLPLHVRLGWYRFVCANGLLVGTTRMDRRVVHREQKASPCIEEIFMTGLGVANEEKTALRAWLDTAIRAGQLQAFVDGPLARAWGVKAAARTWHIAMTGYDAAFADPFEKALPHRKTMEPGVRVPGNPHRAASAYHVAQALAWLAKDPRDAADRLQRMAEIPGLMAELAGLKAAAEPGDSRQIALAA
jgi:hypothetical protein